jgi:hypothetical protein
LYNPGREAQKPERRPAHQPVDMLNRYGPSLSHAARIVMLGWEGADRFIFARFGALSKILHPTAAAC